MFWQFLSLWYNTRSHLHLKRFAQHIPNRILYTVNQVTHTLLQKRKTSCTATFEDELNTALTSNYACVGRFYDHTDVHRKFFCAFPDILVYSFDPIYYREAKAFSRLFYEGYVIFIKAMESCFEAMAYDNQTHVPPLMNTNPNQNILFSSHSTFFLT